ncbi:DUF2141 domain-containing protein [Sphingomonas nostoxanthinifaciens]|nr:DUF2141 domain-containing protein [Sphingomonas nostoxanthinifaciens]
MALLATSSVAAAPSTGSITVTVAGVRSADGLIHVDVCPQANFLHACPWSATAPAQRGSVSVTLHGIPAGRYAVQAFQDANANGDLDRGMFGIPKEGIGFSNDAMNKLKKPTFAVAAFDHGTETQTIPVLLRYFLD